MFILPVTVVIIVLQVSMHREYCYYTRVVLCLVTHLCICAAAR